MHSFNFHSPKRISFIINTKNRAALLGQALERAQALRGPNDEVIVVDGGSNDGTPDVVRSFGATVDVFVSEPDQNGAEALNKGILLARGRYIRQLPDDDITHHEGLEAAIDALDRHPEVGVLVCGGVKQKASRSHTVYLRPGTRYGKSIEDPFRYGACGAGFVIRRSVFAKVGLFGNNISADVAFVLHCIRNGVAVRFCRVNLYTHILYPHSVTGQGGRALEAATEQLMREYLPKRRVWSLSLRKRLAPYRTMARKAFLRPSKRAAPAHETKQYDWDGGFS